MNVEIENYNKKQTLIDKEICDFLSKSIDCELKDAESKIWHAHPVWFIDGNPIVGYSKQKKGIRLMFWSGMDFAEPKLNIKGEKFKDASIFYTSSFDINTDDLTRWLKKSRVIQWDYKNLVKRKGRLERFQNTTMTDNKITVMTTVLADSKKVWTYYTSPEHITNWNFATDSWHCPKVSNELKKGGNYIARMEAKDGSYGFDFEAIYDEIIENEKIVYSMSDVRQVTIDFNAHKNKTDVSITFEAELENPLELQRDGWMAILNNFKKYVENTDD